ncbi:MAG: AAA family ATPase [Nitrospirota bacterium]
MGFSIALAGKGGTGKTSIAGLLIRYLIEKRKGPILAVDADANANLNDVLGVAVTDTVGHIREEASETAGGRPAGMSLDEYFELRVNQALVEAKGFDLIVMGRPEGPGCYCAANHIIRRYTDHLSDRYPYLVMDNEAGLEHLSRRTTQDTDLLIVVSDSSIRGLKAAERVFELVSELKLRIKRSVLIVNRTKDEGLDPNFMNAVKADKLSLAGVIPSDELIFQYDLEGRPLIDLPADSKAVKAAYAIFDKLAIP